MSNTIRKLAVLAVAASLAAVPATASAYGDCPHGGATGAPGGGGSTGSDYLN